MSKYGLLMLVAWFIPVALLAGIFDEVHKINKRVK